MRVTEAKTIICRAFAYLYICLFYPLCFCFYNTKKKKLLHSGKSQIFSTILNLNSDDDARNISLLCINIYNKIQYILLKLSIS